MEYISIREFAKRVGVSDVAVGKAIRTGKIVRGVDKSNPKRPKIIPDIALKEWGKGYDPSYHRTEKVTDKLGSEHHQVAEPDTKAGKSLAEIKRQTAEVRLHEAALDLKKKTGQLVDRDKVYKALFAAGQEVRTAFQAIPDRYIDDILAQKTRNEAHVVLFNAISDTLEMLSEITNRELNL